MARTLGVDHGTRGIRFCLLEEGVKRFFEIGREEAAEAPVIEILEGRGFLDVELIGLTYSMADAINRITDVRRVKNRGQEAPVTGTLVGGGTRFYDEIAGSAKHAVLIPGLHRGIGCLDRRFRLLYSHMAASEKVALSYHAFNEMNKKIEAQDMIISDVSSNTVSIAIKDGRFFGAIDACLGAPGLLHGALDLGLIRRIDSGETTANAAFYHGGLTGKTGLKSEDVLNGAGEKDRLAREALVMAVEMEVTGLGSLVKPQAIAISGSAGINEYIFRRLKSELKDFASIIRLEENAAAIGAAEIARDILRGRRDILGIGVEM